LYLFIVILLDVPIFKGLEILELFFLNLNIDGEAFEFCLFTMKFVDEEALILHSFLPFLFNLKEIPLIFKMF